MGLQPDAAVFCTRLAQSAAKSDQASEKSPAEARFEYDLLFNVGFKGTNASTTNHRDIDVHPEFGERTDSVGIVEGY